MVANKYVCIHGHFYQPPRENAWLEVIEMQDSARPFHDWNERINFECYAPNAAARILGQKDMIRKIVNNYEHISFNFGPTLLSWLEEADPETYQKILDADRHSHERFGGHGCAIAQAFSHLIMPLANQHDRETQVLWGIADFEHRFGRRPEGMWLPETAVDTGTLELLAEQHIRFTILAPRQARAFRKIGDIHWTPCHENIDPRRPYLYFLPSGKTIALFFYDGNISQDVAFKGLLNSGKGFAERMVSVFDNNDEPQLSHIATDGESYGHHHRFGEMALAHCLDSIEESKLATITNYGEFLEKFPPNYEIQIFEESSWSCVHGVERWRSDCGCNTGSQPGWNQAWRRPLREALDWLRDSLLPLFEKEASALVKDPWDARNDYIRVLLDRNETTTDRFISRHAKKQLNEKEETRLLRLMEMQRHSMLMYTSCAWFFSEISGIETNQVLQYALRAMYYARYVAKLDLQEEFEKRLAKAPSNVYENGAVSYRNNVEPTQMNLTRIGMHYAASSIFREYKDTDEFLHYTVKNEVFESIPAGYQKLALGRTTLISQLTYSEKSFSFVVLYLGQQNMFGNISLDMDKELFDQKQVEIVAAFNNASLGDVIGLMQDFGKEKFTFKHLFKDERRKILNQILERSLPPVETAIRDYYEDNYQLMAGMLQSNLPITEGWRNIAQYIINRDFRDFFENGDMSIRRLKFLSSEFDKWNIQLSDEPGITLAAGERFFTELKKIDNGEAGLEHLNLLNTILVSLSQLGIRPELWKSQNLYYRMTQGYRRGEWVYVSTAWQAAYLKLGELLKISTV